MKVIALLLMQGILFPQQNDISLEVSQSKLKQDWVFIAPHENEHVVNQYVVEKVMQHGGVFVVLRQNGERHIHLTIEGDVFEIDPNRIFTDLGRRKTLSKLNPDYTSNSSAYQKALTKTEALANFILATMDAKQTKSWIAIHNNTNGYEGDGNNGRGTISIKRYQKKLDGGANYLIKVHDAGIDEDDLFFINKPNDVNIMANAKWNVVLQNPAVANDPSEDDGSLSVLAEMTGKRYINVEAERADNGFGTDHLEEQKAMIDLTFKILMSSQQIDEL
jgi:hypothetical protein